MCLPALPWFAELWNREASFCQGIAPQIANVNVSFLIILNNVARRLPHPIFFFLELPSNIPKTGQRDTCVPRIIFYGPFLVKTCEGNLLCFCVVYSNMHTDPSLQKLWPKSPNVQELINSSYETPMFRNLYSAKFCSSEQHYNEKRSIHDLWELYLSAPWIMIRNMPSMASIGWAWK